MIIFLIGYMGSGKTKTAESLARKLEIDFLDTDQLIEKKEGKSISEIFKSSGEDYFRLIEKDTLQSLDKKNNVVVATGGGLPCFFDNMDWINAHGLSVYLKVPVGMLIQRLKLDKGGRPQLQELDEIKLAEKVKNQMELRESYYNKAKIHFDIAHQSIGSLLTEIASYASN